MSVVQATNSSASVMSQVGPNIIHHVSNSDISKAKTILNYKPI